MITATTFHTSEAFVMDVDGDVISTDIRAGGGISTLNVSGKIDIDDGRGGRLVYYGVSTHDSYFLIESAGLYRATFQNNSLLVHCADPALCSVLSKLPANSEDYLHLNCPSKMVCNIGLADYAYRNTEPYLSYFSVRILG